LASQAWAIREPGSLLAITSATIASARFVATVFRWPAARG
jgi:hypothetical protein